MIDDAVKAAAKQAKDIVGTVAGMASSRLTDGETRRLSKSEQVQKFLNLSDNSLERVKLRLGPDGYNKYISTMYKYIEEGY